MEKVAEIKNKLAPIFEAHQVALAYLFGSYARKKQGPYSDVDIAVVFDADVSEQEDFDRRMKLSGEISRVLQVPDADVINLKKQTNPVLCYEAVLQGEPIFIKNFDIKARLAQAVLREYEDTRYLRETSYKILREQIKSGAFGRAPVNPKKYVSSQ